MYHFVCVIEYCVCFIFVHAAYVRIKLMMMMMITISPTRQTDNGQTDTTLIH